MKNSKQKGFLGSINGENFYFVTLIVLAIFILAGFMLMPYFSDSGKVTAQTGDVVGKRINPSSADNGAEVATRDMLGIAFDLRSATDFSVFADKGISDDGNSAIKGNIGVGGNGAGIKGVTFENVEGAIHDTKDVGGYDPAQTQKDLSQAYNAMKQLPCVDSCGSESEWQDIYAGCILFAIS